MQTVKVRIAVVVDPTGDWSSAGWPGSDADKMNLAADPLNEGEARYWLEAELPVPTVNTVQAEVTKNVP